MNRLFNTINIRKPKVNRFDLSHEKKLSCKMGDLIPILVQEVVPGDTFKVNTEILMRLAPMLAPVMHRCNVFTHYFFVPNRIIWKNWEKFITNTDDETAPIIPWIDLGGDDGQGFDWCSYFTESKLPDYFGIPPLADKPGEFHLSLLPFLAYQRIYNDFYRDENLMPDEWDEETTNWLGQVCNADGQFIVKLVLDKLFKLQKRCWEKDYFTSALPWTQKGDPVIVSGTVTYRDGTLVHDVDGGNPTSATLTNVNDALMVTTTGVQKAAVIDNVESVNSVEINDLRRALRIQEWLEKTALAGSRYIEQILVHFGIRVPDYRLDRPQYLGGGKNPIVISEVLQTSASGVAPGVDPLGGYAGHGISVGNQNAFKQTFLEHGYIIGLMSVLPRTAYQQGIDRVFTRGLDEGKFDFYFPEFANLGEQVVHDYELYYDFGMSHDPEHEFGYQSRYADYKFKSSTVHGTFRSSLDHWHMGRIFDDSPDLNASFVESDPTQRIFNVVEAAETLYVQLYNSVSALRPMPIFGTPML